LAKENYRVPALSCGVICVILRLAVLVQLWTYPTSICRPFGGDLVEISPIFLATENYRVPALSCGVTCVILRLAVLVQHRHVCDRRTDGQTHDFLLLFFTRDPIYKNNLTTNLGKTWDKVW